MRFTIRDLLWLTVVVALAAAWWMDRSRLAPKALERDEWAFRANMLAERFQARGDEVVWSDGSVCVSETIDGKRYLRVATRDGLPPPATAASRQGAAQTPLPVLTPQGKNPPPDLGRR
jgi:hypothetical protein